MSEIDHRGRDPVLPSRDEVGAAIAGATGGALPEGSIDRVLALIAGGRAIREAFREGWRTNAASTDDGASGPHLDGCEAADWHEFERRRLGAAPDGVRTQGYCDVGLTMLGDGRFYDGHGGEWEQTKATYEERVRGCGCADCVRRRAAAPTPHVLPRCAACRDTGYVVDPKGRRLTLCGCGAAATDEEGTYR